MLKVCVEDVIQLEDVCTTTFTTDSLQSHMLHLNFHYSLKDAFITSSTREVM